MQPFENGIFKMVASTQTGTYSRRLVTGYVKGGMSGESPIGYRGSGSKKSDF